MFNTESWKNHTLQVCIYLNYVFTLSVTVVRVLLRLRECLRIAWQSYLKLPFVPCPNPIAGTVLLLTEAELGVVSHCYLIYVQYSFGEIEENYVKL